MNIKLLTDSASDIPQDLEKKYGIDIMPFLIEVNGEGYQERVDFTSEEFYEMMATSDRIPTTAQITAFRFAEKFEEVYKAGYETLIYVSINSVGSATHRNALMARDEFFENHPEAKGRFRIEVVDSKTYAYAYGYAVVEAAKMIKNGAEVKMVLSFLKDWFDSVEIYFVPLTLEYVKKSGRVSCAAAFVGELLGFRPIISFVNGEVKIVHKVRGDKAAINAMMNTAMESMLVNTPYFFVKGTTDSQTEQLRKDMEKKLGRKSAGVFKIGAAISINAGPKTIGIVVKGPHKHQN